MRVEGHAPCVICTAQVPLMAEVPRARAALDAHVGVAGVAFAGLGFLGNLSVAEANKVRPRVCVCVGGRVGSGNMLAAWVAHRVVAGWTDCCRVCGVRVEGHAPCVVCVVQVPLMAEVPRARAALDAHVGVAGVAQAGLVFFSNLAAAEANIPGLRAAGVKALVTTTLSRHPALAAIAWTQALLKTL